MIKIPNNLADFGALLLSLLMIFSGMFLFTYLFALPSLVNVITGIVCVLILGIYIYTHGGAEAIRRLIKALISNQQSNISLKPKPLQIAQFFYILDDPIEPDSFQDFLDEPTFSIPGGNQQVEYITPAEYIEGFVFERVHAMHQRYGGAITVDANLRRGSLVIDLQFFLDAYDNISKYNDAILGVMLFQDQIKQAIRKVSSVYRQKTERNIQIESNESVRRRNETDDMRRNQVNGGTDAPNPVSITNTVASPQPQKDMNLTLNINTSTSSVSGCISTLITIVLFLILFIVMYYGLFELPDARREAWINLQTTISAFLHDMGAYIQDLGDMLKP